MAERRDQPKPTGPRSPTGARGRVTTDPVDDVLKRLVDVQRTAQQLFQREAGRLARKHGIQDPRAQRLISAASGGR